MSQFSGDDGAEDTPDTMGMEMLRQMATQGMVMPVLLELAERWSIWRSNPQTLTATAAHLSVGALVRHAYDEGGPPEAERLMTEMRAALRNARDYTRRRARNDRKQATGRKMKPRGTVRA